MANFLSDLFDSVTNQQATPQQTIIPTTDLLNQSYNTATGLAPQVQAYNNAYQPIFTGAQLNNEKAIYGSAANDVRQGAYQSILDNLNLGNSVPQDLQDLITTNTLQQLGQSGIGTADAGKLFGARSLLSAGLDLGAQRRSEALNASNLLPTSHYTAPNLGAPDPNSIAGMIDQEQAARDDFANLQEDIRRSNFSSLINTGGRILGTVVGGVFGGPAGAMVGGSIGGQLGGKTGVAGYSNGSRIGTPGINSQSGGGGFTSILSGLFSGGGGAANSAGGGTGMGGGMGGMFAA